MPHAFPPPPSENNTSSKFSGTMKISTTTTTAPTEFPICCVVCFLREIVDWFSRCHMWDKTLYYPLIQENVLIFQVSRVIQKGTVSKCQPFLLGGGKCLFLAWFSGRLVADWPFQSKVPWAATEERCPTFSQNRPKYHPEPGEEIF